MYNPKKITFFLSVCLLISSLFPNRILYAQETAETPGHTLTIYLDRQNQMAVRMAIGIYEKEKKEAEGTEQASYYPEIQWNLVDKSGLEPEAFQAELEAELEAGGGPDLIFVDRDSTRNPYELMAQGCFLDLGEFLEADAEYQSLSFYPGTLEAGQWEGSQYILPLSIDTPMLLSTEEIFVKSELPGNGTESLDSFGEKLLNWQEKSGTAAFDSTGFLNRIFLYGGLEFLDYETGQTVFKEEELKKLCDCYRSFAETEEAEQEMFTPYEKLKEGELLFSSCGTEDTWRMWVNAKALLGEETKPEVFALPNAAGETQTVITHGIGINRNTEHSELAYAAARSFLAYHTMMEGQSGQGLPAVSSHGLWEALMQWYVSGSDFWNEAADGPASLVGGRESFAASYEETAGNQIKKAVFSTDITEENGLVFRAMEPYLKGEETFEACVRELNAALNVYLQDRRPKDTDHQKKGPSLSVLYADSGMGKYSPVYQWLQDGAKVLKEQGIQVNLIGSWTQTLETNWLTMQAGKAEPDLIVNELYGMSLAEGQFALADLSGLLLNREEYCSGLLEAVSKDGVLAGIPYAAEISGIWYNQALLKEAGFPEDWKPESLEELSEALETVRNVCGLNTPALAEQREQVIEELLLDAGIPIFEEVVPEDELEDAIRRIIDWIWSIGDAKLFQVTDARAAAQSLKEGQAAFYFGSSDFQDHYQPTGAFPWAEVKDSLGYAQFPASTPETESRTVSNVKLLFIPESCEDKEFVMELIEACMSSPKYQEMTDARGMLPTRKGLVRSNLEQGLESAVLYRYLESADLLKTIWKDCQDGEKSAEEICENLEF